MIRLFANANYAFLSARRWAYGLTAAFVLPGVLLLLFGGGLNYSIEFTGGTLIQVKTRDVVGADAIRSALTQGGIANPEVQSFGSVTEYAIRARLTPGDTVSEASAQATAQEVRQALASFLGEDGLTIERTEAVGPKVGRELQTKALLAILASFGAVLAYLALRFEWRFGVAAVLATAH
ncbi:MAG: protein translocase subunit SecF, partial [Gemmatimonadales bacterium]